MTLGLTGHDPRDTTDGRVNYTRPRRFWAGDRVTAPRVTGARLLIVQDQVGNLLYVDDGERTLLMPAASVRYVTWRA